MSGSLIYISSGFVFRPPTPILIQSLESKTTNGDPVFNQIQFIPGWERDIWMMNQSHHGLSAPDLKWDRLAIIVDKKGPVKTARFLQLPPGPLEWDDSLLNKSIEYRVSCFICHSNGPRAIRADAGGLKLNSFSQLKIQLWNLRIKTYQRVLQDPQQAQKDVNLKIPFRHLAKIDNETLQVASCTRCHSDDSWLQRGPLTRQNRLTIQFMLESKQMPPPGFSISPEDKSRIQKFILGF